MISIVIPSRRPDALKTALEHISKNTHEAYEVIPITEGEGINEKFNKGINLASGEYVALFHDDIEVLPGWDAVLPENVGSFHTGELKGTIWIWGAKDGQYVKDIKTTPDYSGFLIVKKDVLDKIGPLDELYKEPGHNDADLGEQLRSHGFRIENLPGKILHHHLRTHPLNEDNKVYFEKKWGHSA